jgi:hypothetical protein
VSTTRRLFKKRFDQYGLREGKKGEEGAPGDLGRVDIETNEGGPLLVGEVIRVGLGDTELLKTLEHDGGEGTDALLRRAETAEEGLVGLSRLVEVTGANGGGEKVVGGGGGVYGEERVSDMERRKERERKRTDVSGQMQVELVHRDNLRVSSAGGSSLDAESRTLRRLTNAA